MSPMKKILSLFLILILAACARIHPILQVENAPVGFDLQASQVKAAIITAATDRGWIVSDDGISQLKASIDVRGHMATIRIPYNTRYYSLLYASSKNLDAKDNMIHRNYNRWINNLNQDINKQLAAMAALQ